MINGIVVGYDGDDVLVDINTKTTALCPKSEVLLSKEENIKNVLIKGENYDFIINYPQDEDGIFYLSHKKVALTNFFAYYNNIGL